MPPALERSSTACATKTEDYDLSVSSRRAKVRVTGGGSEIDGDYGVVEKDAGGRLERERDLRPTAGEMHQRHGTRPATAGELEQAFGDLPREPGE